MDLLSAYCSQEDGDASLLALPPPTLIYSPRPVVHSRPLDDDYAEDEDPCCEQPLPDIRNDSDEEVEEDEELDDDSADSAEGEEVQEESVEVPEWVPLTDQVFPSKAEARTWLKENLYEEHLYYNNATNYCTYSCRGHVDCTHFVKVQRCGDVWNIVEMGAHSEEEVPGANLALKRDVDELLRAGAMPSAVHTQIALKYGAEIAPRLEQIQNRKATLRRGAKGSWHIKSLAELMDWTSAHALPELPQGYSEDLQSDDLFVIPGSCRAPYALFYILRY